ncbi:MAG: PEGA domain-containing protein, partial [Polyangia bacterium]
PPVIVEKMPEVATPPRHVVEAADLALAQKEPAADLGVAVAVKPTGAPVKPSKPAIAAVKPTGAPEKPMVAAARPTGAPVKPTGAAVKPTGAAVKPIGAAAKPTGAAAKPTGATAKPIVAVVKPSGEAETPETPDETSKPEKPAKVDKAELAVVTHPAGATVTVDGEARGKSPLTLSLPAGTHELVVSRERYSTVTQAVELPAKVELTLKRPTATLHVDSEPAGGEVIVEGKPRGKTPVDVTLDAFHHYDVQVMLLGTKPWHKKILLKPPQVNVTATLSVVHTP